LAATGQEALRRYTSPQKLQTNGRISKSQQLVRLFKKSAVETDGEERLLVEESWHGVPLTALLDVEGLSRGRVLTDQQDLGQKIVRSVALLIGDSALANISDREEEPSPLWPLQADQLVLVDLAVPALVEDTILLIKQAAQSRCAALALCPAVGVSVPLSWVKQAEALGLPLLELPADVAPAALIPLLVDELLRHEHTLLHQATSIQQRMAHQVLAGRGGQGIAEVLFSLLLRPVLLVDDNAAVLGQAGAWHRSPAWETLSNPERLHAAIAALAERAQRRYALGGDPLPLTIGQAQLLLMPVITDDNVAGWFILDAEATALDVSARLILEQATTAAALELDKQATARQVEWRLRASFLDDLLGHDTTSEALDARARRLGWDLSHKRAVMLVSWDSPDLPSQMKRQVAAAVERFVRAWRHQSLVLERETEVLILPHLPEAADHQVAQDILQTLAKALLEAWPDHLKNVPIVIAIGGLQPSLEEIETSYREARRALVVRRRMGLQHLLVSFDEMRIYSFLERHLGDEEVMALFRHTIGPLVDYDAKRQTDLVRTMEVYFDCNLRLQQAAERLFIHPNSLKYRLQRIRDLLNTDPFTRRDHLHYYLATKLARLL
jgi:sugar diacid utilization regulator